MKDTLKSMLNNLINDRIEEANVDFHSYLTGKMAQVAGIAEEDGVSLSVGPTDITVRKGGKIIGFIWHDNGVWKAKNMQNKEFNTNKDDSAGGKQAAIDHLAGSVNEHWSISSIEPVDKVSEGVHDEYTPILKAHGYTKKHTGNTGNYFKSAGCGTIAIDKNGHWKHNDVGDTDATDDYEGTTGSSLDRHLKKLFGMGESVKSVEQLKGLTQNLSKTTNKYRALKTPGALKGVQRAEDRIERELGQK